MSPTVNHKHFFLDRRWGRILTTRKRPTRQRWVVTGIAFAVDFIEIDAPSGERRGRCYIDLTTPLARQEAADQ